MAQDVPDRSFAEMGHRERKKRRVREQLSNAALRLFAERGYEKTTIEDIASAVDLVPRTFFRYFRSKDDALFSGLEAMRELAITALLSRPAGEGIVTALVTAMRATTETFQTEERSVLVIQRLDEGSPELHQRLASSRFDFQRHMAGALEGRLERSESLVATMITAALVAASWYVVDRWSADGAPSALRDYSEPVFNLALTTLSDFDERYRLR